MTARFQSVAPGARLSDQVAAALEAEIRSGRLAVGAKLPTEQLLASQFSVSRTVVREAISRLKSLGLLDSRQGSGVYVKEAGFSPLNFDARYAGSLEAVIQMVEVRRALEGEVAALAAQRRGAADLARLRQAMADLDQAVQAGGDGVEEDVRFHRAVAEATGNPFLIDTLQYLGQFLRGVTQVTRANEARRADFARQVSEEHLLILQAIELADPDRARQAAAGHMSNAIDRIRQADPAFWQQEGVQLARPLLNGRPADPPR